MSPVIGSLDSSLRTTALTRDASDSAEQNNIAEPVGDGNYVVQQDCVESIASRCGLLPHIIWDHPRNLCLKEAGRTANILLPGDRLFVPDLEPKTVDAATDRLHAFRLNGTHSTIELRVLRWAGEPTQAAVEDGTQSISPVGIQKGQALVPRKNAPYILLIEGEIVSGHLDSEGWLVQKIPANARKGILTVDPAGDDSFTISLSLGGLDPKDSISGIWQRLVNLGFASSSERAPDAPIFRDAVGAFRLANGLKQNGETDADLQSILHQWHLS